MDEQHEVHIEGDALGLPFPVSPHEVAGRHGCLLVVMTCAHRAAVAISIRCMQEGRQL